ncbi:type II/IV secretion system ATPase subunit [Candidatus Micrarchaeota archaeon]|jgi:flagellar protein FlaI|nr:type II/IV secretion system ATPase subunit [Candidatus Micrarchaeota archaeon]
MAEEELRETPSAVEHPAPEEKMHVIESYFFKSENIPVNVKIVDRGDYVPYYELTIPGLAEGTKIVLNTMKGELITKVRLDITEIIDPKKEKDVKQKFETYALYLLKKQFPSLAEDKRKVLASYLLQSTLGLDELEPPLHDESLEEICVNNSQEPVWVYHKKHNWCKTNIWIRNEEKIYDYSAMIGRKIGRQINILNPLMDAHLGSGDRVNATLSPVSSFGNTITIRKFSRNPWTIPVFVANKTTSAEVAAWIWLCVQNEMSLMITGGTGSGKTSFLNAVAGLIPPNQRIISIEDTRELTLPSFLHWIPMVTREPNPEGKGEVSMLDLMVNSLRMRPDRIIVGEVRRKKEAEILMEAMHTGHSVYATFHADNSEQALTRLTNPPINIPKASIDALAGLVVQFRHRRLGIRRTLEMAEIQRGGDLNVLHRWDIRSDKLNKVNKSVGFAETLNLYAGLSSKEIDEDIKEKSKIITWMVENKHMKVDEVGHIISRYYFNPDEVIKFVDKNKPWDFSI